MIEVNYSIDQDDLKAFYLLTKNAFGNMTFTEWCRSTRDAYLEYTKSDRETYKSFSQWVNGQMVALTN